MKDGELENIQVQLKEIERMVKRTDDFLFNPVIMGQPSRAEQIDQGLSGYRAGLLVGKFVFWLAGFIAAAGVIIKSGWFS